MQCTPIGMAGAWTNLTTMPIAAIERLFKAQLKHAVGGSPTGVSASDVLRALAKATKGASEEELAPVYHVVRDPTSLASVVSLIRLIVADIVSLQVSDAGTFSKKFSKGLSRVVEVGETDTAVIDAIGGCLSEDALVHIGGARLGGAATFLSCTDVGVEEVVGTGLKQPYVVGYAVGTSTPKDPSVFSSVVSSSVAGKLAA